MTNETKFNHADECFVVFRGKVHKGHIYLNTRNDGKHHVGFQSIETGKTHIILYRPEEIFKTKEELIESLFN